MRRYRRGLVGVVVCLALLGAACSSSSGSSETVTTEGGSSKTTSGDGSPIVIGGVGTLTGFAGVDDGVRARLERANAEGGVLGHKIEYLGTTDDGGAKDANATAIRELVQQKKVDAVVPLVPTSLEPQTAQFLLEQKVPFVGMGFGPAMCGNEAAFPFNGCNVPGLSQGEQQALTKGLPSVVGQKDLAGTKVAIIGSDASGGKAFVGEVSHRVKALEATVVYTETSVPANSTNVQSYVDAVISSKADLVIVVTDFVAMLSIQGGLKAAGYTGALVNFAGYVPGILESSTDMQAALEGSYIVNILPSPLDDSAFATQMNQDFKAIGAEPTFGALLGYNSVDLYLQLLTAAGGDPTKVIATGNDNWTFDQGPGGFKTPFPESHTQSAQCSGLITVKSGEYVLVEPFTCID